MQRITGTVSKIDAVVPATNRKHVNALAPSAMSRAEAAMTEVATGTEEEAVTAADHPRTEVTAKIVFSGALLTA